MKPNSHARPPGFTLIELLVVLTIIATLAGISLAVFGSAISMAKKKSATVTAIALRNAVNLYYSEYRQYPADISQGEGAPIPTDAGVMDILLGLDAEMNPRQLIFWEVKSAGKNKLSGIIFEGGDETSGTLVDPFGNPYYLLFDNNHDGRIPGPNPEEKWIWDLVFVYSAGEDGDLETWEDNVVSE